MDGQLLLTRNQNGMFRDVPLCAVPEMGAVVAQLGMRLAGADQGSDVGTFTGGPVCALADAGTATRSAVTCSRNKRRT